MSRFALFGAFAQVMAWRFRAATPSKPEEHGEGLEALPNPAPM